MKDPCPRSFLSAQSCSLNCKGRFVLCQLKPDFIHGECKRESSPLCEEGSRTGIHPSPRDSEVPFAWGKQTRTVWLVSGKTEEEVGAIPAILGHAIRKLSTPDSLCLYTFHRINPNLCPFCQLAYSCWLGRLTHPLTLCVYTSFVVFFSLIFSYTPDFNPPSSPPSKCSTSHTHTRLHLQKDALASPDLPLPGATSLSRVRYIFSDQVQTWVSSAVCAPVHLCTCAPVRLYLCALETADHLF